MPRHRTHFEVDPLRRNDLDDLPVPAWPRNDRSADFRACAIADALMGIWGLHRCADDWRDLWHAVELAAWVDE